MRPRDDPALGLAAGDSRGPRVAPELHVRSDPDITPLKNRVAMPSLLVKHAKSNQNQVFLQKDTTFAFHHTNPKIKLDTSRGEGFPGRNEPGRSIEWMTATTMSDKCPSYWVSSLGESGRWRKVPGVSYGGGGTAGAPAMRRERRTSGGSGAGGSFARGAGAAGASAGGGASSLRRGGTMTPAKFGMAGKMAAGGGGTASAATGDSSRGAGGDEESLGGMPWVRDLAARGLAAWNF